MPDNAQPEVNKTSFRCPHCGTFAHQFWYSVYGEKYQNGVSSPLVKESEIPTLLENAKKEGKIDKEKISEFEARWHELAAGNVIFGKSLSYTQVVQVHNLSISRCYHCEAVAVWRYDRLVWPGDGNAPVANPDLPAQVRADYDEAARIVQFSPRGAAGLLRLAIQKLCEALGESGGNLNRDIASLVASGLDIRIQRALDIVRVIGNNAVHPGQIDLKDDTATAMQLFNLVNLIANRMISEPQSVEAMYERLPENSRKQIEKRDQKKTEES